MNDANSKDMDLQLLSDMLKITIGISFDCESLSGFVKILKELPEFHKLVEQVKKHIIMNRETHEVTVKEELVATIVISIIIISRTKNVDSHKAFNDLQDIIRKHLILKIDLLGQSLPVERLDIFNKEIKHSRILDLNSLTKIDQRSSAKIHLN